MRRSLARRAGRRRRAAGPIRPHLLLALLLPGLLAGCSDFLGSGDPDGPPEVVAVEPSPSGAELSVLTEFTLTFSFSVRAGSLEEGLVLETADGRRIRARMEDVNKTTIRLAPTDPLDFGEEYRVRVTPSLLSRKGTPAPGTDSFSFATEGEPLPPVLGDSLLVHLRALAHDSTLGRGSGTDEELKAAQYLADRLGRYGLEAPPGGMIQPFQAPTFGGALMLNTRNVLATVPGSGRLAGEWIILGAHYDHLGVRAVGGGLPQIHNGADDNASGTALVLELARIYRAQVARGGMAGRDRRSVLFVAFGSEEQGLLGSKHYVNQDPVVPLSRTDAMLNFDMVGRLRDNRVVIMGAPTSPAWEDLMANANDSGLILVPWKACNGCSDHSPFMSRSIPILWPYTGSHDDYHRPSDDVEFVNVPGMVKIGQWTARVLSRLAVMPRAPAFQSQG